MSRSDGYATHSLVVPVTLSVVAVLQCCELFSGVGPTPRNFTRGFTWVGHQVAQDYYGNSHTCDHYTGGDPTALFESVNVESASVSGNSGALAVPRGILMPLCPCVCACRYWTEQVTHHDVRFIDGGGPVWAWDRLNVTTVDPSVFELFADAATCATPCGTAMGREQQEVQAHAIKHDAFIKLSLHHAKEAARIAAE